MSYPFQLSEEQYDYLLAYTKGIGETPETFFQFWVEGITDWIAIQRTLREKERKQKEEKKLSE